MYKVFTIWKNIYKLRITLKKNEIFNSHKSFFLNYVVPHGTARREWVKVVILTTLVITVLKHMNRINSSDMMKTLSKIQENFLVN